MANDQKIQLITNISPTISIYADELNYILIMKNNPKQALKNARHSYHRSLRDLFEDLFELEVRRELANNQEKTIDEMVMIIRRTKRQIQDLIRPFEELGSI